MKDQTNRPMYQDRDPEIDPREQNGLIFDKGTKAIQLISTNGAGTTGHPLAKRKRKKEKIVDTKLTSFTKINSKQTIDINVKYKTIELVEDHIGENQVTWGWVMIFLDTTLKNTVHERKNC